MYLYLNTTNLIKQSLKDVKTPHLNVSMTNISTFIYVRLIKGSLTSGCFCILVYDVYIMTFEEFEQTMSQLNYQQIIHYSTTVQGHTTNANSQMLPESFRIKTL